MKSVRIYLQTGWKIGYNIKVTRNSNKRRSRSYKKIRTNKAIRRSNKKDKKTRKNHRSSIPTTIIRIKINNGIKINILIRRDDFVSIYLCIKYIATI